MNAIQVSKRPQAVPFNPTPEQAVDIESAKRSSEWFWQLPPVELGKYANQSVAVYECAVVAVAPTLDELLPKLNGLNHGRLYLVPAKQPRIRFQRA